MTAAREAAAVWQRRHLADGHQVGDLKRDADADGTPRRAAGGEGCHMKAEERRGAEAQGSEAHEDHTVAEQDAGDRAQSNADSLPVNDLADAALEYARNGWGVFPCIGKKPAGLLVPHGLNDASRDPARIAGWWSQYPKGNIGATPPEGCWVLDIDVYKNSSLQELIDRLAKLQTPMQRSGGGGVHFLFEGAPPSARDLKAIYGEGLDIKTHAKGYVLVAPSVHPDTGALYAWERPFTLKAAPTPAWLSSGAPPNQKDGEGDDAAADLGARALLRSNIPLADVERALRVLSADCDNETWFGFFMGAELDHGLAAWPVLHDWSKTATEPGKYRGEAHCRAVFERCKDRNDRLTADSKPKTSGHIVDAAREALASTTDGDDDELELYNPLTAPPPQTNYLLGEGIYLPDANEQVSVFGKPDSFKSVLLQAWCAHMAAGLTFDHRVVAPRVVVFAAEEASTLWDKNLHAWRQHFGALPEPARSHALGNLNRHYLTRFRTSLGGMTERRAKQIANLIVKQKAALGTTARAVLVLDPLAEVMLGDESKAEDIRKYVAAGKLVQRVTSALIVHVHHTGHSVGDRERGSSAFPGKMYARYQVERPVPSLYSVELHCKRHKAREKPAPSRWDIERLALVPIMLDADGKPETGVVVRRAGDAPPPVTHGDVQAAQEANDMARLVQAYRQDPTIGGKRLRELLDCGGATVKRYIDRAVQLGLVKVGGGSGRAGYSLTDEGRALAHHSIGRADRDDDDLGLG